MLQNQRTAMTRHRICVRRPRHLGFTSPGIGRIRDDPRTHPSDPEIRPANQSRNGVSLRSRFRDGNRTIR